MMVLRERELCLCELEGILGVAPSTISKHMSILADAGLVQSRREGRWTHYELPVSPTEEVARALDFVQLITAGDPILHDDAGRIKNLTCR